MHNNGRRYLKLGTQQDFVNGLKARYVTPVLQGILQGTERLETRTASREAQGAISAISEKLPVT